MHPGETQSVPVVAAFDFDGTLTRRDTLLPFLASGLGLPRLLLAMLKCSPWLLGYAIRLVPNDVAKQRLLRATLSGRSLHEMQAWTAGWLADDFASRLRHDAMAQLATHQQQGHCCVMVSASPDVYLERVARQMGFDGLICTVMEVEQDHLTGHMQSPNCHGEQKVLRLNAWMQERFGQAAMDSLVIYAYGDTSGDKPMLRLAAHAFYRGLPWKPESSTH